MDPAFFQSVHGAGVGLAMEKEEAKSAELNSYHSRLAVKVGHYRLFLSITICWVTLASG